MPRFAAQGASLDFELAGAGPALLLAHGFGCGRRSWQPQLETLARVASVGTYDARAHGASDAPADPAAYSPAIFVSDLVALLDHLGLARASIGGLSMGANVALHFALEHPDRIDALILADVGSGSDASAAWRAGVEAVAARLEHEGIEVFADASLANAAFARYAAQGAQAAAFIRACLTSNSAQGLAHVARGVILARPSLYALEARLRALRVPTLLIAGEHDDACIPVHRFLADVIPGARHVVLPGVGHLSNLEAPEEFNAEVAAFLREHAPPRG